MSDLLERFFPEREVYVRSHGSVRYLTLSSRLQLIGGAVAALFVAWIFYVFIGVAVNGTSSADRSQETAELHEFYQARVQRLEDLKRRLQAELDDSERRFDKMMNEINSKQSDLGNKAGVELALQGRLEASRRRLSEVTSQRDDYGAKLEESRLQRQKLERKLAAANKEAKRRSDSFNDFVATLDETVGERDKARSKVRALSRDLSSQKRQNEEIRKHQDRVMAQLSEATEASIGQLERILKKADVNVNNLVKEIERTYSGKGGPFIPLSYKTPKAARGFPLNEKSVAEALEKMERVSSLTLALEKLPLAKPLRDRYRRTSGFGPRRHPVTKRWTAHHGVDMAAPRGTKIYSPVDGVVTYAAMQSGYGKVVKVRHALGYETVYAHMSKIRVRKGEAVKKGTIVGEVGSTGRSTGDHLHYEVRRYRKPLNPERYFRAGEYVF